MTNRTALAGIRGHLNLTRFFNRAAAEGYAVDGGGADPEPILCRVLDDQYTHFKAARARRDGRPLPAADTSRFIWVTPDQSRGVALVKGRRAVDLIRAAEIPESYWSHKGGGVVVPLSRVPDVHAAGQHLGIVVRDRKPIA